MVSGSENPIVRFGKFIAWVAGIAGAVFGYLQWQIAVDESRRGDRETQAGSGAQQVEATGDGPNSGGGTPIRDESPALRPEPVRYFAGSAANYLSLRADDPTIAGTLRGLFQHGSIVTELSPRFVEDGRFRKALSNDERWRMNLEVPDTAQMLYLVEVGPIQRGRDTAVQRAIAARGVLRIVVLDLARGAMVKSEQIPLNGSAFTEESLQQELGQQLAGILREHVREIMKDDQS
jgi:hypothetical protein